ncbi:hypothetical protein STRAU_6774 [Streptomyces aurantiacus JA 4570]|uniref:Uncharacterized protein n=1 Tax=Streptomyces aurantiacus JA 4570 TaxID=1286094 RepID=S3Z8Y7_9ACTN|nr:hypothetical protein STRAU_6774 [Streptomyces aurantiacus JA 4570]
MEAKAPPPGITFGFVVFVVFVVFSSSSSSSSSSLCLG